jgi:pyridoxamine 5'-phosphate oxidase
MTNLADLRTRYARGALSETEVARDPFDQFRTWFDEALSAQVPEPNAMTLATVREDGQPAARIVLLKNVDARGFTFFTNYLSDKGHALATNPHAALLFHWVALERQVRIEGTVEKIEPSESDAYYQSRPLESRLGAWASEQSKEVPDRATLEQNEARFAAQFGDQPPRPPHWGGYRLSPKRLEFWQGRPSRLHDRILFDRQPDGDWRIARLSP